MEGQSRQEETDGILRNIESLAEAYVPEWRMDREQPDAGTALALAFAELFAGVRERSLRLPEKYRLAFFGELGLTPQPASPAEGYVAFGLSKEEFGGTYLPKDTPVSAECEYRTKEAVYVSNARLVSAVLVDGKQDYLAKKDIESGFSPFACEEANEREHSVYLCGGEELCVSAGASLALSVTLAEGEPLWCEGDWVFSCLTDEGFTELAEWKREGERLLLMPGEQTPAQGELFGVRGRWLRAQYPGAWKGLPLVAESVLVASEHSLAPDLIWNLEGEQAEPLFPFGHEPAPFSECYFASAEALGKAGAAVTLSFFLDYERVPFDHSVPIDRRWKLVMRRSDFVPDPEYDITIGQVMWEYYNGSGWSRLEIEEGAHCFGGSGGGGEVSLTFVCPEDAALLEWQAAPTRYLRARITRMNNLYRQKGAYIAPVLERVRFSYAYTNGGRTPERVISVNNCAERRYEPQKKDCPPMELFFGMSEEARALYLGFQQPLAGTPLRALVLTENAERESQLSFSCSGRDGFFPIAVVDGTKGFTRSGTLTFAGNGKHEKTCVCGSSLYWLRITGGGECLRIRSFVMNAARVAADTPGKAGNAAVGTVTRLGGSYGYVSSVTNPLPLAGGEDEESLEETLLRGSAGLWHRDRAVTAADFEALTREASRSVARVRCYPNRDGEGNPAPGSVALVLLLREYSAGSWYFDRVREQVKGYLLARMGANPASMERLYLLEPLFVELDVSMEVAAELENSYEVQEEIRKRLFCFLNPLTGNYDGRGWEIGALPKEAQLANALKGIPGLLELRQMRVCAFWRKQGKRLLLPADGGREAETVRQRALMERVVVLPGTCDVTVENRR